jgi:hypothetical protein
LAAHATAGAPNHAILRTRRKSAVAATVIGRLAAGDNREGGDRGARARLNTPDGNTTEWKSHALRAYPRRTLAADALIAGCYLAGTNTRRLRRALGAVFAGAVGKDTAGLAQGEERLGRVECPLAAGRADRAFDP